MTSITSVQQSGFNSSLPAQSPAEGDKTVAPKIKKYTNKGMKVLGAPVVVKTNTGTIESIQEFANKLFANSGRYIAPFKNIIVVKQLVMVVLAPWYLYNIMNSARVFSDCDKEKQIDLVLDMLDSTRSLGEAAGAFILGLTDIKAIAGPSNFWAKPFAGVMGVLSIVTAVKAHRTLTKINRLIADFDGLQKTGPEKGATKLEIYEKFTTLLEEQQSKDHEFIKTVFHMNDKKFMETLLNRMDEAERLVKSDKSHEQEEGIKTLNDTLNHLKTRITRNIFSARLLQASAAINFIGTVILLVCPAIPVGWGLIALAGVIDLTRMGFEYKANTDLARALSIKRTWLEALTL